MNAEEVANKLTDDELAKLERKIAKVYKQAGEEIESKLADYMAQFDKADAAKLAQLADGKITQAQYSAWRQNKMMSSEKWQQMRDTLAQDYVNADKIAAKIINGEMPNVYALNHNYASYAIENGVGMNLNFTLYDKATVERLLRENVDLLPHPKIDIAKDLLWNKQKIQSAVTQGILQGEPMDKIAKRLQQVTDMNKTAAIRNARTATTGAQSAGRLDSYESAKAMGVHLKKKWIATLDARTRDAHGALDEQVAETDEPFHSELGDIRCPGDPYAAPANVYNCRCTMKSVIEGVDEIAKSVGEYKRRTTYEDWKKEKSSSGRK
jgi:SPP1 gp7 family putative phage head morphogenesis protein